jgi:hypothetical protein
MGCRGGCQRIALFDKGKRRIQTDFGSHRPMRRVCPNIPANPRRCALTTRASRCHP